MKWKFAPKYIYLINGFVLAFILCFHSIAYESGKHGIHHNLGLPELDHFITPSLFGILGGLFGLLLAFKKKQHIGLVKELKEKEFVPYFI